MKHAHIEQLNIRISSDLKRLAKQKACERHQSLNGYINSIIESNLKSNNQKGGHMYKQNE